MQRGGRNEAGKLFIGGLSWDTDQDTLLNYFSQYGEVVDCVVMKNLSTGKSRGFGFVTFKDTSCVDTVLSVPVHIIDGRQVDAKACNPKAMNRQGQDGERKGPKGPRGGVGPNDPDKNKKIFMGGLPNVDEEFLKDFFNKFGKVKDVTIMKDAEQKKSRGFGFLTFEEEESVDRVCEEHYININGKKVECKKAQPRDGRVAMGGGGGGGGGPTGGVGPQGPIQQAANGFNPHQQDGEWGMGGGNWNAQGGPRPGFPDQFQQGFQQQQGGFPGQGFPQGGGFPQQGYQQPPQGQQPPGPQPGGPGYQQGNWSQQQQPGASPGQQAYGGQPGYGQPAPGNTYGAAQWSAGAVQPVSQAQAPSVAQPSGQPAYGYGQPGSAPGVQPYGTPTTPTSPQAAAPPRPYGDYSPGQPSAQPAPGAAQAYAGFNPYGSPQAPAGVPDPYAQPAPVAVPAQPGAAPAGYGATSPGVGGPPTDPQVAQPKPADYGAYGYGGYGDAAGFGAVAQPAAGYPGQPEGAPAYNSPPGAGGYQRTGAAAAAGAQGYHPYRR